MIAVGDIVSGVVIACETFGAFIEHDGVQYFVPMHELSWYRISHSRDVVSVGDRCEIVIDRPDNSPPGGPLASLRRAHPELNPWADPSAYSAGTRYSGPIANKFVYGWFVKHPRGAEGLLHADDIPLGFDAALGDVVSVEVTECNVEAQQFRLSLVGKP